MKHIVLFVVFVLGIVFMQYVQGQSAEEVINKYLDARGGKDRLMAIKTLYMEGSRQMMGNEVAVKITKVQDKLSRTDFEMMGSSGYTIVTPTHGWSFIPMRSENVDVIPEARLKTMLPEMDIPGPLVDYASKGNKIELQGKQDIDGTPAYKLKVTFTSGKEVLYFIDTKTNLLIRTSTMAPAMGQDGKPTGDNREVLTNYSDYKAIEGILFPHTIATTGGQGAGSTTFDKIELNKAVDEGQYKPGK
jgi:hypothetical protein